MTRPTTYLVRMAVFLVLVAIAVALLSPTLWTVFWNNPELNGLILLVLATGIGWNLMQVLRLKPEVAWLEHYRQFWETQLDSLDTYLQVTSEEEQNPDEPFSIS